MKIKSLFVTAAASLALTACSNMAFDGGSLLGKAPTIKSETETGLTLRKLPKAERQAVVAVYDFADKTGQHKPSDNFAEFSRAITQGATAILNEALTKAGNGSWFKVIERKGLDNLLRERQIIAATREQYSANKAPLPPMLYAGIILEGGVISYETNTVTGGLGARYLGVGGSTEYRQDIVTVYLRAVNVQNGEILLSTNASKTIFSTALGGSAFRFVAFDELLEIESGFTLNEPPQFAVRQAIESSVYSLIMEGANKGLWSFENRSAGTRALRNYKAQLAGESVDDDEVEVATLVPEQPKKIMRRNLPAPKVNKPTKFAVPKTSRTAPRVVKKVAPIQVPSRRSANIAPVQVPKDVQPTGSTLDRARELAKQKRNGVRKGVSSRSYKKIGSNGEELFCDSRGCYPFNPGR